MARRRSRVPVASVTHDHSLHLLGELASYGDLLGSALDVHAESLFLRLGVIMKRLTAITVIIMVPNLVASIYGMNFEVLFPPNDWEYGFFVVVGLLACMIIWGFIHSRHLDWLWAATVPHVIISDPSLNHLLYARRPSIFRSARAMWTGIDASGLIHGRLKALINGRVAALNGCEF